jgi:parallel beta-helix repeat protein
LVLTAAFTVTPAVRSFAQELLRPVANVRDYGAVGDGVTNDTAAIQRAENDMAAKAGIVYFPAGTYIAAGVRIDSNVEFTGEPGATLKHLNGTSGSHIVTSRVFATKGSIVEGSNRLTVTSTKGVVPGAVIAVRAAGGASPVQTSTLSTPMPNAANWVSVASNKGWGKEPNYLLVENEVVAYKSLSGSTMQGVTRGALGTAVAFHPAGSRVSQLNVLYARVAAVGANVIDLDRVAIQGVRSADVYTGSMNMTIRGLTLDGSRVPGGSTSNPFPLNFELARGAHVEGCTIRNGDHGAVRFDKGTVESTIQGNTLTDNGTVPEGLGAAVWLYRGSSDNVVANNVINGLTNLGITPDDRSESATEYDAPADRNLIVGNVIDIPKVDTVPGNAAIFVSGSNGNVIEGNDVRSTMHGVWLYGSTQGIVHASTSGNVVRNNKLANHDWGLNVSGNDNWLERNQLASVLRPFTDKGTGNQFVENTSA